MLRCQAPDGFIDGSHGFVHVPLHGVQALVFASKDVAEPIGNKTKLLAIIWFYAQDSKPSGPRLLSTERTSRTEKTKECLASVKSRNWIEPLLTVNSPPVSSAHARRNGLCVKMLRVFKYIVGKNRPGAKLGPALEAASKYDTSPAHTIVAPCRLRCSSRLRRLHSGFAFENLNSSGGSQMKRICILSIMIAIAALGANAQTVTASGVMADPVVVNCDQGQSINGTLSRLNKHSPATVLVRGTCTEFVQINGFEGLTLKGLPGATLQQPSTDPGNGLIIQVLLIEASRSITIDGFAIHSRASAFWDIGIGRNSIDVQLRNLTVDGPSGFGIFVYESSQVSLARVTARDPGFATVGVVDVSDVHIESCLFENSTGAPWHQGLFVSTGHVTMQTTTIRNMQVGIGISDGGIVDIQSFNSYFPISVPTDVVIDNPAGTNFFGVAVGSGALLNLGDTKLRITNPGQPGGGNSAGVSVSDGGTLSAGANLVISGSRGHGVFVSNNSHASLAGSSITGSGHGGLVVANLSTVAVGTGTNPLTQISGNGTDLFCDSKSLITGGANIANATSVQCGNLLTGDTVPLP